MYHQIFTNLAQAPYDVGAGPDMHYNYTPIFKTVSLILFIALQVAALLYFRQAKASKNQKIFSFVASFALSALILAGAWHFVVS